MTFYFHFRLKFLKSESDKFQLTFGSGITSFSMRRQMKMTSLALTSQFNNLHDGPQVNIRSLVREPWRKPICSLHLMLFSFRNLVNLLFIRRLNNFARQQICTESSKDHLAFCSYFGTINYNLTLIYIPDMVSALT